MPTRDEEVERYRTIRYLSTVLCKPMIDKVAYAPTHSSIQFMKQQMKTLRAVMKGLEQSRRHQWRRETCMRANNAFKSDNVVVHVGGAAVGNMTQLKKGAKRSYTIR